MELFTLIPYIEVNFCCEISWYLLNLLFICLWHVANHLKDILFAFLSTGASAAASCIIEECGLSSYNIAGIQMISRHKLFIPAQAGQK